MERKGGIRVNQYVTGATIKALREKKQLTQMQLAAQLNVSDKAVSKWETGKGLPDVMLLEPLAKALGVSVIELMSGEKMENRNRSCNMLRSSFYVCPVCGNILHASGEAVVSCCGITLPPLEAEPCDADHDVIIQQVEDEQYLTIEHPMTKEHAISFMAWVTDGSVQLVKFYPEGEASARMQLRGFGRLYVYCNHHGLMQVKVGPGGKKS